MKTATSCPVCDSKNIFKKSDVKDYFLTQENFSLWKCKDCNLVFTNPRPDDEESGRYYESPDYLSHNTGGNGLMGKLYRFLREKNIKRKYNIINKLIPTGTILDIGCGTGELLNYFQKNNWHCQGIEPNVKARNFAKMQYDLKVKEESFINFFTPESFDIISMWHVLEHVPDVNHRMQETKHLLKKEGYLIIALPNPTSWDAKFYKDYWAGLDVPRHLYHFSPDAFKRLVNKHNLRIVNRLPLQLDAFYVSLLSERYKRNNFATANAFFNGLLSNIKALNNGNYSSIIYILTHASK